MMIRLDPATKRSAVLSFPRDLWVKIPGHGTQRINGAFSRDNPQLLIDTIKNEFDVRSTTTSRSTSARSSDW